MSDSNSSFTTPESMLHIDFIEESDESLLNLGGSIIKKSEELKEKKRERRVSILNSQARRQKILATLASNQVSMVSSKLKLNSAPVFTLQKI